MVVPEPVGGDAWQFGDFVARVVAARENGNLLVEDQDSDVWEIGPSRLTRLGPD